jgi:hypothetical protein
MKALNLIIAFLLCTQAYGQDFDFNDLKVIDSEKAFKRFCFENEFVLVEKETYEMTYAFNYTRSTESAVMWFSLRPESGTWYMQIVKQQGASHPKFNKVLEQVKSECTFYDFQNYLGDEYICYTCPRSKYSGKIGFRRGEKSDYIRHFHSEYFED